MKTISIAGLAELFDALRRRGHRIVGPTIRDQAIIYDLLESPEDLPVGWTDEQDGGSYRLKKRDDDARFGYVVGPQSWKQFIYPPSLRLWAAHRTRDGFDTDVDAPPAQPLALFGARACELKAIAVQDRVFNNGEFSDPTYQDRRDKMFVVAVNCGQAGGTCFCVSMKTGPGVTDGFDLALTEVIEGDRHYFTVDIGSDAGAEVMADVTHTGAKAAEQQAAADIVERTAGQMGRTLDTTDIKDLLQKNPNHPRWEEVAARCLTCGNCTQVCPTCFCSTVQDSTSLDGTQAERVRKWDSCFTLDFTHMHGGNIRPSASSRYRQWLTHKLANWIDQFGTSGCVGCGRCITWCPVGIDITREVAAIRESAPAVATTR